MNAKASLATTPAQIRWLAAWMTVVVWLIATPLIARFHGQTLGRAATIAIGTALTGLIAWVIYHTISRRNDGLAILITSTAGIASSSYRVGLSLNEELGRQAVMFVVLASTSIVFGLFLRKPRRPAAQTPGSPLWDADLDPPSPG